MKSFLKKFLQRFVEITIVVVVLLAILLGVVRFFLPYVDRYRPDFETWATAVIHYPVKIEAVSASWKGLHPIFSFKNVEVLNPEKNTLLLKIDHAAVGVNLIASLLSWQFKPSLLHLTGANVSLHQSDTHILDINGIKLTLALPQPENKNKVQALLTWLLTQGEILIDNVNVNWYTPDGQLVPLTNLQLKFRKGFTEHQLIVLGSIARKPPSANPLSPNAFSGERVRGASSANPLSSNAFLGERVRERGSRFRLVVNLQGDFFANRNITAKAYLYLRNVDLSQWLSNQVWQGYSLKQGQLQQARIWLDWSNKQVQSVQSVFTLTQAALFAPATQKEVMVNALSGNFAWKKTRDGMNFAADQVHLRIAGQTWPLSQLSMQTAQLRRPSMSAVQIFRADKLDLSNLESVQALFAIIPETHKDLVEKTAPQGVIENFILRREIANNGHADLSASADFAQLRTKPWEKLPGVENVSGAIKISENAGDIRLNGHNLKLDYAALFSAPLSMDNYTGRIEWINQPSGLKIRSSDIAANNAAIGVRGNMDVYYPSPRTGEENTGPYVHLLAAFSNNQVKQLHHYLPQGIFPQPLTNWLNKALVDGKNIHGQILLQGPLRHFPFDDHTGHFEMAIKTEHVDFNIGEGWPMVTDLNADLHFDGKSLEVDSPGAKIFAIPTKAIHARVADLSHPELNVQSGVEADLRDGMRFIFASPLKNIIGNALKDLQPNGPMQLAFNLELPLYLENVHPKIQGDLSIVPGAVLNIPAWNISLKQLQGQLLFTENSVTAEKIQGIWLNQPVAINISTELPVPEQSIIKIKASGSNMPLDVLEHHYDLDSLAPYMKGELDYVVLLQANKIKEQTRTTLTIDSDLAGVSVNLPAPLKKTAEEKIPSRVELEWGGEPATSLNIFANYDKRLSAALLLQSNKGQWAFKSGDLRLGATPAILPKSLGLTIDGELASLNWAEVENDLAPLLAKKNSSGQKAPIELNKINLSIGQLAIFGMTLNQANIILQPLTNAWSVQINSPLLVGKIVLPENFAHGVVQGEFERFTLMPGSSKAVADINPGKLPALNLVFHDFYYGDKAFGEIFLRSVPEGSTMQINELSVKSPYYSLAAAGQWRQFSKGKDQTTMSGDLSTSNLGQALKALGMTGSLEGSKGKASFALSWPAAAFNAGASNLNGNFSIDFKGGRIINMSQSTEAEIGLGRLLNLFSLQSIPRRLSLDFSDITQKGFNFDEMKGNFSINNGQVTTNNAYLDGPIAKVEIKGRIGLAAKNYDLRMLITPYITSSVPVVAAFAGGPVIGAAAFVAQKVLGNVVGKITSHMYQVTGSWDSPNIIKLSQLHLLNTLSFWRHSIPSPLVGEG